MARSGRKPFSTFPPPPEETAEAISPDAFAAAYAGSYTPDGDKVIHHVEVCSIENFANTDQVRSVTLQGDRLTLRGEGVLQGVSIEQNSFGSGRAQK